MEAGHIKIYRGLGSWRWGNDPVMVYFWVRILLMANWEDKEWRDIVIKRGSFVTTVANLSSRLGLSIGQVRTCLNRLRAGGEVAVNATNNWTLITICKYEDYQQVTTNEQQTNNKRTTYTKEIKKEEKKVSKDTKEKIEFPFSSEKFMSTWEILVKQPKWKGKTVNALQLSLNKLSKFDEEFAIKLMEDSIENGWQGVVFPQTGKAYEEWKLNKKRSVKDEKLISSKEIFKLMGQ